MDTLTQLTANAARLILGGVMRIVGDGSVVIGGGRGYAVVDECSGINSIVAISLLAFAMACFRGRTVRQWVSLLLAPVLAWCGNVLRICIVILCGGNSCVHDLSGYAIFVLVLFVWLRIFER